MVANSVALSETSSGHSNSMVEERAASSTTRNSDSRSFSTVLEQSKEENTKQIVLKAENREMKTKEKTQVLSGVKKKLISARGLNNSKSEFKKDEEKLELGMKEKLKYSSKDRSAIRGKLRVLDMPGDTPNQVSLAINESLLLTDMPNPKNRKNDRNDGNNPEIRRTNEPRSNLTSIAPRVEVQDRRLDAANSTSRMRGARRHFGRIGEDIDGESRLENRLITTDMEVEIPSSFERKDSRRSAAMEFARKLDTQVGNEIVKQIKIVLNRASAGEVRINLKPDNLGRVRIQIQLEDNHLSGKFFVESAAAREVLKGALDGLQSKLLESGFEAADLEMAWEDAPSNFGFNHGNPRDRKTGDAVLEFENSIPISAPIGLNDNLINLVV